MSKINTDKIREKMKRLTVNEDIIIYRNFCDTKLYEALDEIDRLERMWKDTDFYWAANALKDSIIAIDEVVASLKNKDSKSHRPSKEECGEELRTALDTANRSSKAVLKWNAEIELRTKEDCKQIIKDKWWPHDYGYKLESILQAIDSAGVK